MFFSHAQLGEWGQVRGEGGIDAGHMICPNPVCLLPSAWPDLWRQPNYVSLHGEGFRKIAVISIQSRLSWDVIFCVRTSSFGCGWICNKGKAVTLA